MTDTGPDGATAMVTELTIEVPGGVVPGTTKLAVSCPAGGELRVLVPAEAKPGDKLILTEMQDGEWSCTVVRPRPTGMGAKIEAQQTDDGLTESVSFLVPPGATPGVTQLAVPAGNGEKVVLAVPDNAIPGDKVVLVRDKAAAGDLDDTNGWRCSLHRDKLARGEDDRMLQPFANLPKLRAPALSMEVACQELFKTAKSAGCVVSDKLVRGSTPPLNIPGLLAAEDIEAGEELMRVPERFHITPRMVERCAPELWEAIFSNELLPPSRREEVAQAAYVAELLHAAEDRCARAASLEAAGFPVELPDDDGVQRVWADYADGLLGEDFAYHPYRVAATDPNGMREAMDPSPEADFFLDMAQDLVAVHTMLVDGAPPAIRGRLPDLGMFLRARLSMITRVFQAGQDSSLVPVCDLYNHSPDMRQGVAWRWVPELEAMVVTAERAHKKGEEIFCSYGPRSNLLLYRTYGFTHTPEVEPSWSYIVRPGRVRAIYETFLPSSAVQPQLMLDSKHLDDTLCDTLNQVAQNGRDAASFLRLVCARCLWPYEQCSVLQPAIRALLKARETRPDSCAWWEELSGEDRKLVDETATRVRMCEYLCLTSYLEAVDMAETGKEPVEGYCLEGALHISKMLVQAINMLKKGRFFALKKVEIDPDSLQEEFVE